MADRVVQMTEDETHDYYLWDSGFYVCRNRETREWSVTRIPTPTELLEAHINREASPEVCDD